MVPDVDRAAGPARDLLRSDPHSPRARLERYIVLRYPAGIDLDALRSTLELDPAIEWVGPNRVAEVSMTPNDPFYDTNTLVNQWGIPFLRLDDAWEWVGGNAYVGVIDTGIYPDHVDLRGQRVVGGSHQWSGGAYRPHLSFNFAGGNPNPDEYQQGYDQDDEYGYPDRVGHGTFMAGTLAATTNNSQGVAGACLQCSLLVLKASQNLLQGSVTFNNRITESDAAAALAGGVDRGAQVLNLSFGYRGVFPCHADPNQPICQGLAYATARDVVVVAASGNDGQSSLDFPASEGTVFAAGGVLKNNNLWSSSNYGWKQFLSPVANWSTFYPGISYAPNVGCDDSVVPPTGDGYGACTGTSVSSPFLAGSLALLRSANPWLSRASLDAILKANVRPPNNWHPSIGIGIPEVDEALFDALGRTNGAVISNRLTPFFSMYNSFAKDWLYTTVPQWGAVSRGSFYVSTGPDVPGYADFPGAPCVSAPCPSARASIYLLTGTRAPYADSPPLHPLYRMTYKAPSGSDRDTAYTTTSSGILALASYGLKVDGVEGYLYAPCTPEPSCIPAGATKVLQRYSPTHNDHAVFPENELATMQASGYTQIRGTGTLGYAYRNLDADGDAVIDGFEGLIGTNPSSSDSDCDAVADGDEILVYGLFTGYGDPLDGTCP